MLQHSNLNQSHEGEYEDTEQIEDVDASTFDSDSWVNNNEELNNTNHGEITYNDIKDIYIEEIINNKELNKEIEWYKSS